MITTPHSAAKIKTAIADSKVQPVTIDSTKLNQPPVGSKPKRVIARSVRLNPPITAVARQNPAAIPDQVFDFPTAIASGAINEKQLIAILTEMCRSVLAAQRKKEFAPATD